jgi:hypothetical protein
VLKALVKTIDIIWWANRTFMDLDSQIPSAAFHNAAIEGQLHRGEHMRYWVERTHARMRNNNKGSA